MNDLLSGYEIVEKRDFVATRVHSRGCVYLVRRDGMFQAGSILNGASRVTWLGSRSADAAGVRLSVERDFAKPDSGRRWAGEWLAQAAT